MLSGMKHIWHRNLLRCGVALTILLGFVQGFTRVVGPVTSSNATMLQFPSYTSNRFSVSGRDWPASIGQASVCLWAKDAVAAFSLTIDDNLANDHGTWLALGEKYGQKFTWMVIEKRVGSNVPVNGDWSNFVRLFAAGHDIQSHSYDHDNMVTGLDLHSEYAWPVAGIQTNVPGTRVLTLAYPGGTFSNDTTVADQYYIGARGTTGTINEVRKLQYRNTCSVSSLINLTNTAQDWCYFPNVFNPAKVYYRGWYAVHYHGISASNLIDEGLAWVAGLSNDLWSGTYRQVIQYAQERETARLVVDSAATNGIRFTLRDGMDDTLFDAPLAVKVRVDPTWTNVSAIQGTSNLVTRFLTNDTNLFVLVEAVPDRGSVTLSPVWSAAVVTNQTNTNVGGVTNAVTNGGPSAPTSLGFREIRANRWSLEWGVASSNAGDGFLLERKEGGSGWWTMARLSPETRQTVDGAVTPGVSTVYRIAATNAFGSSPWVESSNLVAVRRLAMSGSAVTLIPDRGEILVTGTCDEKNFDETVALGLSWSQTGSGTAGAFSNLGGSLVGPGRFTNVWRVPGPFQSRGRLRLDLTAALGGVSVGNAVSFTNVDLGPLNSVKADLQAVFVLNNPWDGKGEGIVFADLTASTTVVILSPSGRRVAELKAAPGSLSSRLIWTPASTLSPGVYLAQIKAGHGESRMMKIVVKP